MLGGCLGSMAAVASRLAATASHSLESGTHTYGRAPSRAGSQLTPRAVDTCVGCLAITDTVTHRASALGRCAENCAASRYSIGVPAQPAFG